METKVLLVLYRRHFNLTHKRRFRVSFVSQHLLIPLSGPLRLTDIKFLKFKVSYVEITYIGLSTVTVSRIVLKL